MDDVESQYGMCPIGTFLFFVKKDKKIDLEYSKSVFFYLTSVKTTRLRSFGEYFLS